VLVLQPFGRVSQFGRIRARREGGRLRDDSLKRRFMFVLLLEADKAGEPNRLDDLLTVLLLVVLFGGVGLVLIVTVREASGRPRRLVSGYLDSIGFHDRRCRPWSSPNGDDYPTHKYPVTDGRYDPSLYSRRGGSPTKSAMHARGIDEYDVYKSNVEEAE
jgi:hypothetical protein